LLTYAFRYINLPSLQKLVAEYGIEKDEVKLTLKRELERHKEDTQESMQFTATVVLHALMETN
jgi:hypothetical protein